MSRTVVNLVNVIGSDGVARAGERYPLGSIRGFVAIALPCRWFAPEKAPPPKQLHAALVSRIKTGRRT